MILARLLPLALLACTGNGSEDTGPDTDTNVDTDTGDTAEAAPVWKAHPLGISSTLNGVFLSADGIFAVGTDAAAYITNEQDADGDELYDWTQLETTMSDDEDFLDLWGQGASDTLELLAGGTSGNVARYTNGTWLLEDLGTSNHEGVGGAGPTAMYAVSWGGVYRFDGGSWTFEAPPGEARLNDVWASGDNAVAVGEAGVILQRNPETGWAEVESGTEADLNAISGTALNDLWAVGADGTVVHFDGVAWAPVPTNKTEALWGVFAPATDAVFVVGNNGTALLYNGTAWEELPTGVTNNLYAIHGASEADVWAVGNRGMALKYTP